MLEHLHVLANYQWDQKPLLTLVLVGLPELWARLRLHKNRALWSRIHCRVAIEDPSPEDTVKYVSYRLRAAGTERQIFTSDALAVLHEGTSGILRDIDAGFTPGLPGDSAEPEMARFLPRCLGAGRH